MNIKELIITVFISFIVLVSCKDGTTENKVAEQETADTEEVFNMEELMIELNSLEDDYIKQELGKEVSRLIKEAKEASYDFDVNNTSIYENEFGAIRLRYDFLKQDLIFEPVVYSEDCTNDDCIHYTPYFYNYGGDVILTSHARRDRFLILGSIEEIKIVDDVNKLKFKYIIENEKYGQSAIIDWETENDTIKNIYMTPMALHKFKNVYDDERFVYIRSSVRYDEGDFPFCYKDVNVIFYVSGFERFIIKNKEENIEKSNHWAFTPDNYTIIPLTQRSVVLE